MNAKKTTSGKFVKTGKAKSTALTQTSVTALRRSGSYESARIAGTYLSKRKK